MQKKYLVVGGSKGIGLSIVKELSREDQVFVWSRNKNDLVDHKNIFFSSVDILKSDIDLPELPDKLDGMVYCPGSIDLKPFRSTKEEQFIQDFQINVMGAVRSVKAVLRALKKSDSTPGILFFSTVASNVGMPFHSSIATSKSALEGLTKSLAAEFAPKIRVNCIAPSLTNTSLASSLLSSADRIEKSNQRHPLKRIGKPEDIAAMACFLLSDQSSWITGQIIGVDGGLSSIKN